MNHRDENKNRTASDYPVKDRELLRLNRIVSSFQLLLFVDYRRTFSIMQLRRDLTMLFFLLISFFLIILFYQLQYTIDPSSRIELSKSVNRGKFKISTDQETSVRILDTLCLNKHSSSVSLSLGTKDIVFK